MRVHTEREERQRAMEKNQRRQPCTRTSRSCGERVRSTPMPERREDARPRVLPCPPALHAAHTHVRQIHVHTHARTQVRVHGCTIPCLLLPQKCSNTHSLTHTHTHTGDIDVHARQRAPRVRTRTTPQPRQETHKQQTEANANAAEAVKRHPPHAMRHNRARRKRGKNKRKKG